MSKIALKVISLIMVALGIVSLVPTWVWFGSVTQWVAVTILAIGVVGFALAYSDKS